MLIASQNLPLARDFIVTTNLLLPKAVALVIGAANVARQNADCGRSRDAAAVNSATAVTDITITNAAKGRGRYSRGGKGRSIISFPTQKDRLGRGQATGGGKVICAKMVGACKGSSESEKVGCRASGYAAQVAGRSAVSTEAGKEAAVAVGLVSV